MRILLVMDPGILVPPAGYGGIERILALMAAEYVRLGHDVDLLVTAGSHIEGCTTYSIGPAGFPPTKGEMNKAIFRAWGFLYKNKNKYDLIHNFGRLLYLFPVLNHPVKKIMCYQREITRRNIQLFTSIPHRELIFSGCSANLVNRAHAAGNWAAIHNGIDFKQFTVTTALPADAPLVFLGRIERIKGCHAAIEVARKTGNRLIIAGNVSRLPEEQLYYEQEIAPQIDGEQIIYVGEVNDVQKNSWLGKAKAFLMPIEWDEPFGIVMIEAMACGTPVIGYRKGSVPEVVVEGVTGNVVESMDEMINAVYQIRVIDRSRCREVSEKQFDISVIAKQYLSLFNF